VRKTIRFIYERENLWLVLIIYYSDNYRGKESLLRDYRICEHSTQKRFYRKSRKSRNDESHKTSRKWLGSLRTTAETLLPFRQTPL